MLGLNDALDYITCEELGVTNKNFINNLRSRVDVVCRRVSTWYVDVCVDVVCRRVSTWYVDVCVDVVCRRVCRRGV